MKAVRIFAPGDIRLVDEPIQAVGKKQVLCKVEYAGICGTDYSIYSGELEDMVNFPLRPGHEWSGIVHSVGDEVTQFKPGDRVIGESLVACDACIDCIHADRKNCKNRKSVGTVDAWPGAMCEYELFSEGDLIKLSDNISMQQGALVEPAANAMMAVVNSGIGVGSSVAVMGTGPIGIAAAAICRAYGARTVISVGRSDYKLDVCKKLGATHIINTNREDAAEKILEYTNGQGVDVSIEVSGSKALFDACIKSTKKFGDIEMIAFYEGAYPMDLTDFSFRGLTLRTAGCGGWGYFDKVLELMDLGLIDLTPMITHRCSLDEAAWQIKNLKTDNSNKIKVMIKI